MQRPIDTQHDRPARIVFEREDVRDDERPLVTELRHVTPLPRG
jgi:hypothetical protein